MHKIRIKLGWSRDSATSALVLTGRVLFLAISLLLALTRVEAIDISAAGGWTETIDENDLQSGAGSNLIATYESVTNASTAGISNCTGDSDNWRVDVKRSDSGWQGDFVLYAKRTSDGTGTGSISGGLSYIEITTADVEFFSGAGNRDNIDLQYRLTGMSVNASPNTYNTTIMLTIVDEP